MLAKIPGPPRRSKRELSKAMFASSYRIEVWGTILELATDPPTPFTKPQLVEVLAEDISRSSIHFEVTFMDSIEMVTVTRGKPNQYELTEFGVSACRSALQVWEDYVDSFEQPAIQ